MSSWFDEAWIPDEPIETPERRVVGEQKRGEIERELAGRYSQGSLTQERIGRLAIVLHKDADLDVEAGVIERRLRKEYLETRFLGWEPLPTEVNTTVTWCTGSPSLCLCGHASHKPVR